MEVTIDSVVYERVQRVRDAHYAYCPTCNEVIHSQYWDASHSRGLHQSGTGHKVWLIRVSGPATAD